MNTGAQNDLVASILGAAEHGLAQAQFTLAAMLVAGYQVDQDMVAAVKWYRRAAAQGHALSCLNLAVIYAKGTGLRPDPIQARAWIKRAFTLSHSESLRRLATDLVVCISGRPI